MSTLHHLGSLIQFPFPLALILTDTGKDRRCRPSLYQPLYRSPPQWLLHHHYGSHWFLLLPPRRQRRFTRSMPRSSTSWWSRLGATINSDPPIRCDGNGSPSLLTPSSKKKLVGQKEHNRRQRARIKYTLVHRGHEPGGGTSCEPRLGLVVMRGGCIQYHATNKIGKTFIGTCAGRHEDGE